MRTVLSLDNRGGESGRGSGQLYQTPLQSLGRYAETPREAMERLGQRGAGQVRWGQDLGGHA